MSFRVIHRPDQLLQRNNARDYEAEGLASTFIGKSTAPAHQALERFIDERLALRAFDTVDGLRQALEEWPAFYRQMHGSYPHKDWSELRANFSTMQLVSGDGDFSAAIIQVVVENAA